MVEYQQKYDLARRSQIFILFTLGFVKQNEIKQKTRLVGPILFWGRNILGRNKMLLLMYMVEFQRLGNITQVKRFLNS